MAASELSGVAAERSASTRSKGRDLDPLSQTASSSEADSERIIHHPTAGIVNEGSVGSVTFSSRSQPSFSNLICWIATAFALASRSGVA